MFTGSRIIKDRQIDVLSVRSRVNYAARNHLVIICVDEQEQKGDKHLLLKDLVVVCVRHLLGAQETSLSFKTYKTNSSLQ